MNYVSTTELGKKSLVLRESLKRGENTYLLHRSKVIGVIEPHSEKEKVATSSKLKNVISKFPSGKDISYSQRKDIYLSHLDKKYGKGIS